MVDLLKLKAGDTVHFRCGGKAVVNSIIPAPEPGCLHRIFFVGYTGPHFFRDCEDGDGLLGIIRIEPAFRWEDVKPGMAFKHERLGICWYVGPSYGEPEELVVIGTARGGGKYQSTFKEYLTPAPEHDIEVVK